ncbi:MAG TPA: DNA polymerase IV [Syntrophales bacterium]|nr:DNA polymerase IV [Syntrophales bacterium]
MYPDRPRRILHIDMDAFFAAVEQKRHPELLGKAVVIGGMGDPTRRGVVATASYEARLFGIHSAMPLKTAYRLKPEAVFLPVDYEAYMVESRKVKQILRNISPIMEDVGIDEAFLDISALNQTSLKIAEEIKSRIHAVTGLTCSIGIGPNKLLAKMASDMKKPDGVTLIGPEDIETLLWPLPVRKLWGVGPKTETRLRERGIACVGDLAVQNPVTLNALFGKSYGHFLYEASRGIDDSSLITHWEPRSISREMTFQRDIVQWQIIAKHLAGLAKEVALSLREERLWAKTVTVKIRFGDFQTLTRSTTLTVHSASEEEIRKAAFACLKRFDLRKRIRLIGVRLSHLDKTFRPGG